MPRVCFPAFSVTPVDTTAAGDAFTGALAVGLAAGGTLDQAIPLAGAAAALACTKARGTAVAARARGGRAIPPLPSRAMIVFPGTGARRREPPRSAPGRAARAPGIGP